MIRSRGFATRLVLGLLLAGAWSGHAIAALPDLIEGARASIVGVGTVEPLRAPHSKLLGTGFVIADGLTVVTNLHVASGDQLAENERLVVFIGRGKHPEVRPARIAKTDRFHDLAVLRIEGEPLATVRLATADTAREGQAIALIGFPIGAVLGLYPVTHSGIISSLTPIAVPQATSRTLSVAQIRRLRDPFEVYQLDAIAYPGNSGSPLFDVESGLVIGIVNSVLAKAAKEAMLKDPSAIAYAIPIVHLLRLLEQSGSDTP